MKKIFILVPLLFLMMVGSAFASVSAPSEPELKAFKAKYPPSDYFFYKVELTQIDGNQTVSYWASKKAILFRIDGSKMYITNIDDSYRLQVSGEFSLPGKTTETLWTSNLSNMSIVNMGEMGILRGVGLKEVPAQMVETGGIILPVGLTVLGALLIVGLVRRFPHWFLRF